MPIYQDRSWFWSLLKEAKDWTGLDFRTLAMDGGMNAETGSKLDGGKKLLDEEDVDCWADTDDAAAMVDGWMKTLTSHYLAQ